MPFESVDGRPCVRVLCAGVHWVGEQGAIVGVRQFNDTEAPHHQLEIPLEFPILLDAQEADAFQFATHGAPSFLELVDGSLDSLVLCEIRIHAACLHRNEDVEFHGELVIADECRIPGACGDDGLLRVEDSVVEESSIRVSVGDALAMALRFSLPVLLDLRYVLQAAGTCLDRMRLEQLMRSPCGRNCDLELVWLRERLARGSKPAVPMATVGSLLDEIKALAWYWADYGREPAGLKRNLRDYQLHLAQLRRRSDWENMA